MLSSWTQTTSQRAIVAVNKVDLLGKYINTSDEKQLLETIGDVLCLGKPFNAANIQAVCGVSCKAGTGVDGFANALNMVVRQQLEATGTESALITRERHRNHVNNALEVHGKLVLCNALNHSCWNSALKAF
jgi:tRNA U34 5-carboxymethylaminomethyl modifying GTPase MnmE/TrmE